MAVSAARGALVGAAGLAALVGGWFVLKALVDPTPEGPKEFGDTLSALLIGIPLILGGALSASLAVAQAMRLPQFQGMVFRAIGASFLFSRIAPQPVLRVVATLAIFAAAGAIAEAGAQKR